MDHLKKQLYFDQGENKALQLNRLYAQKIGRVKND